MDAFEMTDLIYEEDTQHANHVSTTYFSEEPVEDEHLEILGAFARMLTNHLALAHCEVMTNFYQESHKKRLNV